ncbi:MAG: hypothetical protein AAF986_02620 [Pseudomonadota bacterium]
MTGPGLLVHATAIRLAVDPDGPLCGICFIGPPGSGKSLTAFEALAACPYGKSELIADDALVLFQHKSEGVLAQHPAAPIATSTAKDGPALELRGSGILRFPSPQESRPCSLKYAVRRCALPGNRTDESLSTSTGRLPPDGVWAPFGQAGPSLPLLQLHNGGALRLLVRSLLTGHSLQGGFDSISVS